MRSTKNDINVLSGALNRENETCVIKKCILSQ